MRRRLVYSGVAQAAAFRFNARMKEQEEPFEAKAVEIRAAFVAKIGRGR